MVYATMTHVTCICYEARQSGARTHTRTHAHATRTHTHTHSKRRLHQKMCFFWRVGGWAYVTSSAVSAGRSPLCTCTAGTVACGLAMKAFWKYNKAGKKLSVY